MNPALVAAMVTKDVDVRVVFLSFLVVVGIDCHHHYHPDIDPPTQAL